MVTDKQIDERIEALREQTAGHIRDQGWSAIGVFGGPNTPNFNYTIGLALQDLPELIIFGLDSESAHYITHAAVRKIKELNRPPADGEVLHEVANMPLILRDVPSEEAIGEYLIQAREFYFWAFRNQQFDLVPKNPTVFRVMQMVFPDRMGAYPWEPECEEKVRKIQTFIVNQWSAP